MTDTGGLHLCLDQGGGSSRALVFDGTGHCLASAQLTVSTRRPHTGWVEQDPVEVVTSLLQAAQQAIHRLPAGDRPRLRDAGLATQRSSLLCWRRDTGAPLSPILSWQDVRGAPWLAARHWPEGEIRRRTGLMPNAHFGVSKLRWCLDNLPQVRAAADGGNLVMGPLASYLTGRLTDSSTPPRVDPANASRTLLMNLQRLGWDEVLVGWAGLDVRWLPVICPTESDYGTLACAGIALPLRIVTGDQSAAAFALGYPRPDTRYINVGTGAFVFQPIAAPVADTPLLNSIIHRGSACHFALEGTVNGAGSALSHYAEQWGIDDLPAAVDDALAMADSPLLFLNGIGGLGAPDWRPDFASRFIGEGNQRAQLRAVIDSILFLLQHNMTAMNATGLRARRLMISGGLANSDGFCQQLSDLSGQVVTRTANTEATARGTAFLLAGLPEDWRVEAGEQFSPAPDSPVRQRYGAWQQAMADALTI